MAADSVVRARIDAKIKKEAAAVLAEMGLTVSDAIRLMLIRTARDKQIPFNPLSPNAETVAAMEDAIAGRNRKRFDTVGELMTDLSEDESE